MQLYTPVELPQKTLEISPDTSILFLGSCFASRMGERMLQNAMMADVNPFGTLYNPLSIALCLSALIRNRVDENWFFQGVEGLYHSRLHSTLFSASTKSQCQSNVVQRMSRSAEFLSDLRALVVTFGTADVFEHSGMVVANCHKQPASQFKRRRAGVVEIVEAWKTVLKELWDKSPGVKVVMTVSPYRYLKMGLHDNQLSKSILLLAIQELQEYDDRVLYFPAYEIVMDELRDYRFYESDMLHVSSQTADYIWDKFSQWSFTASSFSHIKEWTSILRDLNHKPLYPDSLESKHFREAAQQRRAQFISKLEKRHQDFLNQFS